MKYKKLEFVARKWRDYVSPQGVRVIEPVFDGAELTCTLVCTPIPGTDPPQVEYSCRPDAGCDSCQLVAETDPGGAIFFWCRCTDESGLRMSAKAGSLPVKAASRTKAKRKKQKKG